MSDRNDEQFDAMLSGFMKQTLDPHRGRAERGFRRHLDEAARSAWRMRTWVIGAFATGMAASVAMLWAAPIFRAAVTSPSSPGTSLVASGDKHADPTFMPPVERVVQSHTTDEGVMVFGNDAPFRVLRRQRVEPSMGPNQAAPQPDDEWMFIKMPTY